VWFDTKVFVLISNAWLANQLLVRRFARNGESAGVASGRRKE
jgi:hypothetical protein